MRCLLYHYTPELSSFTGSARPSQKRNLPEGQDCSPVPLSVPRDIRSMKWFFRALPETFRPLFLTSPSLQSTILLVLAIHYTARR